MNPIAIPFAATAAVLALSLASFAQAAMLSPATAAFGGQSMGTTSPAQVITFTNNEGGAISMSSIVASAQFAQTNNCPAVLPAAASCTINVSFIPAVVAGALNSTAPATGSLVVSSSGAGSPHATGLSGTAEKSLVTHYYRSILRRAPDSGGKAFWESEATRLATSLGANVNETWFAMATFFYFSAEYTAFGRSDTEFVTDLYNTFFNRGPDAGGLSFWIGQINAGVPREIILVSFMFSTEFQTFTQGIFGNTAARKEVDTVVDFYRGILSRLPDTVGFDAWVSQFRSAQCTGATAVNTQVEAISSAFMNSGEYAARNRTNAQFVGDIYNAFLRRGGDQGGVLFWVGQLNSGASRNAIRQQFIASPEFQARVAAIIQQGCLGNQYFMSPGGSDTNNGKSATSPFKSFSKAFSSMVAGDELILLDGTYSVAAGTGYISFEGTKSAQPPSGLSLSRQTVVRAQNPGNVKVIGGFFLGRSTRKDSYIKLQGITFVGNGELYNCDYCTVKDVGVNGTMNVGSGDHNMYSDHNLVEDVWVWASGERVIAINYRSHFNTWRRVIVRGDGCGTATCAGSGSPNVGITVYESSDISLQNVVVVDRVLAPTDTPYADFATAQHTPDSRYFFGRNEWLGTMSIRAPDTGYYMEQDAGTTVDPTIKIANAIAWDSGCEAFNISGSSATNVVMENLTARTLTSTGCDGLRVGPELSSGILRNVVVTGLGRFGINSRYQPRYVDLFFTPSMSNYNQTNCVVGCFTTNPRADSPGPSLKYLPRIEAGSKLAGAGEGGADIGANVRFRYGADGTRFGDPGFNSLTTAPLWPWPNEARIKSEMCASTTRGFCTTGKRLDNVNPVTFTSYIWEYLGNPMPAGF